MVKKNKSNSPHFFIEDFEGRPQFVIETSNYTDDNKKKIVKYLRFGVSKAKKILKLVPEIKKFVEDNNVKQKA